MSNITDPNAEKHGIVLSERVYDLLKDLDLIALPALAAAASGALALYGVAEKTIGLVVGTIAIVITIIGILLKISNVQYKANAKVTAAQAAINVTPRHRADALPAETITGPGIVADPNAVVVDGPSQ